MKITDNINSKKLIKKIVFMPIIIIKNKFST